MKDPIIAHDKVHKAEERLRREKALLRMRRHESDMLQHNISWGILKQVLLDDDCDASCKFAGYLIKKFSQRGFACRNGETHLSANSNLLEESLSNYLLFVIISNLTAGNRPVTKLMHNLLEGALGVERFARNEMKELDKLRLAVLLKIKNPQLKGSELKTLVGVSKQTVSMWLRGPGKMFDLFEQTLKEAQNSPDIVDNVDEYILGQRAHIERCDANIREFDKCVTESKSKSQG
jgi:predicted XRE-type DNA-binding protein